jgi:hypothetical protein
MFDESKTSVGDLDEGEQLWAFRFLRGDAWDWQFECLDEQEGNKPPDWLVRWSDSWQAEPMVTIDDLDPLIAEYLLVVDTSNNEVWAGIHQGDDQVMFERVPVEGSEPACNEVCDFLLKQLEQIGGAVFTGNMKVDAPRWLPRDRMEAFLIRRMKELGRNTMHGLTLEKWLQREYGKKLPNA